MGTGALYLFEKCILQKWVGHAMSGKTFIAAIIFILFGFMFGGQAVMAQQSPIKIDQFDYWGAYSYNGESGKVCYALSAPTSKEPTNVNHGDVFFILTKRANGAVLIEPQFMAGYDLREGSQVEINVDDKQSFSLFTKDSSAWLESADNENSLVSAMRAGATMQVKAVSRRGTNTSYAYSLKGVTAALNAVNNCQ